MDMQTWKTGIAQVISSDEEEEILVRGKALSELIGNASFSELMYLLLVGRAPSEAQARVLDALLVAGIEHGIAPPSMISRCFASYGTNIQSAVAGGVLAFGDRMGGLGEQLAKMMVERLEPQLDNLDNSTAIEDTLLQREAQALVAQCQSRGERIPGFGIPLHGADPRAPKVLEVARREGVFGCYCRFGELIEEELARARGAKPIPMNIDGASAVVALDLGFDWRATRMLLITPRSVSMAAHFLEEQSQDTTWRHIPAAAIEYD